MSASLTVPRTGKPLYFKIQLFIREPDNLSMNFSGTFRLRLILSSMDGKLSPSPQSRSWFDKLTMAAHDTALPQGRGRSGKGFVIGKERARIVDPGPCCGQPFKDDYFSSSSS
jgi:hypothetical protein